MNDNIKTLLTKYISGNADESERLAVRQWIGESQDNLDLFISLKASWDDALHHPGRPVVDTPEAFRKLRARLGIPDGHPNAGSQQTGLPIGQRGANRRLGPLLRAAIVTGLIVAAGAIAFTLYRKGDAHSPLETAMQIFVPKGKMKKLLLPDSSEVWLNAGTQFSYAAGFGQGSREVWLEGEGYFAVRHNAALPFIVHTRGYTVKDIGTTFTISAYSDTKDFRTAVIEGEVEVSGDLTNTNIPGKLRLTRNEVLKISGRPSSPAKSATPTLQEGVGKTPTGTNVAAPLVSTVREMDSYAGWKDHLLVFNEETFDEVARRLERTFDVTIRITSGQLAGLRYTGRFNKVQDIREALAIIKATTPIVYSYKKDTIIISPDTN